MTKIIQHSIFVSALITSWVSLAQESLPNQIMTISPDKCVIQVEGQSCQAPIDFSFHLPKAGRYCVYRLGEYRPLFCFDEVKYERQITVEMKDSAGFVLVDENTKSVEANLEFRVLTYKPALLGKRRKRVWGIL